MSAERRGTDVPDERVKRREESEAAADSETVADAQTATGTEAEEATAERAEAAGAEESGPGLEERLRRLEEIVSSLEADEVDLDRALGLFEEGIRHVRAAERILSETELRVEELLEEGGETRTRAFEGRGGEGGA